jgi:hypothetical protein
LGKKLTHQLDSASSGRRGQDVDLVSFRCKISLLVADSVTPRLPGLAALAAVNALFFIANGE